MTSTHVIKLQYHTAQTHVMQLLLHTKSQWLWRQHMSLNYNITQLRHTSCNYYFILISVVMTSTHVMQLQYHTLLTHEFNYYFVLHLSGYDVYTCHAITISHSSDTRIQLLLSTTSQWLWRLHASCNHNITLFKDTQCYYYISVLRTSTHNPSYMIFT
jgi:hypothetical protein